MTETYPQLKLKGKSAAVAAAQMLATARPYTEPFYKTRLSPGDVWGGKKIIIAPSQDAVYYMDGDELYDGGWATGFVKRELVSAFAAGGAKAMGMVHLAEVEITFLMGVAVPWYLMLGLALAKAALFYHDNRETVDKAVKAVPKVYQQLKEIRERYPTLFSKMASGTAREIMTNLGSGVAAEDVAFFLGRCIKGVGGLPEVALKPALKAIAIAAVAVTAVHLPAIAGRAAPIVIQKKAAELQLSMARQGIMVSTQEATKMLDEMLAQKDTAAKLQQLQTSFESLIPVLNQLQKSLRAGS